MSSPCRIRTKSGVIRRGAQRFYEPRLICAEKYGLDYHDKEWFADHTCGVPNCTNPDHIQFRHKSDIRVARFENKTNGYKLSEEEARAVKDRDFGPLTLPEIGAMYGVTGSMICAIRNGRAWPLI